MTDARAQISELMDRMRLSVIGQDELLERLVIALLANGHVLMEGAPGLAKTRAARVLARNLEAYHNRIQFTPDLMPSEITGTDVFQPGPRGGTFQFRPGPIFANIVLADEINRAPAKVQAALLEAMDEQQVTVGGNRHRLPNLFMVLATQNPLEHEGTYPLPASQLDRFAMQLRLDYPSEDAEVSVLRLAREEAVNPGSDPTRVIASATVFEARAEVAAVPVAPELDRYIGALIAATRQPNLLDADLARWIEAGVSTRAALALDACARAHAWLHGHSALTQGDVLALLPDVFRHRITLSYEAIGAGVSADQIIADICDRVPGP